MFPPCEQTVELGTTRILESLIISTRYHRKTLQGKWLKSFVHRTNNDDTRWFIQCPCPIVQSQCFEAPRVIPEGLQAAINFPFPLLSLNARLIVWHLYSASFPKRARLVHSRWIWRFSWADSDITIALCWRIRDVLHLMDFQLIAFNSKSNMKNVFSVYRNFHTEICRRGCAFHSSEIMSCFWC